MSACIVPGSLFLPNPLLRGLFLGAGLATVLALLTGVVIVLSGSATVTLGGWAEGWTAEALQPLLEHGYRVIHHAGLRPADIDHFLVGPAGVFVLETKWSSQDWNLTADDWFFAKALQQVRGSASTVELWLSARRAITVQPVLVLWGGAAKALQSSSAGVRGNSDGDLVVEGHALRDWGLRLPRTGLTPEQVDDIHTRMRSQVRGRDDREPPAPRSIPDLFETVIHTGLVSVGALYLPAAATQLFGLWGLGSAAVLQTAVGVGVRRVRGPSWPTVALLACSGLWGALLVTLLVWTVLSS